MKIIDYMIVAEEWFNNQFAWFFTNGMKAIQESERKGKR